MDNYRNLAGMLVGIGMLAGGTGRNGAMYALNSLNGMMKGCHYRHGVTFSDQ